MNTERYRDRVHEMDLLEMLEECTALLEDRKLLSEEGLDGIADIAVEESRTLIEKIRGEQL